MTDLSLHIPEAVPFADDGSARAHYREVGARLGREVRTPVISRPKPVGAAAPAPVPALPASVLQPASPAHRATLPMLIIGPMNIAAVRALAHFAAGQLDGPLFIHGAAGTGKTLLASIAAIMCPDARIIDDAEDKALPAGQQLRPRRLILTSSLPVAEVNNPTLRRACAGAAVVSLFGLAPLHARAVALSMLAVHRRHFPDFTVPDPVLDSLAAASSEGHFIAAAMKGLLMRHWAGEEATGETLAEVLATLRQTQEKRSISIAAVQKVVAQHFGVSVVDMRSARRTASVVVPRQVAMCLAKRLTLRSLPEIGRRFGGRDHTTVLHAVRKFDGLEREQPGVAVLLADLAARIEQEAAGGADGRL